MKWWLAPALVAAALIQGGWGVPLDLVLLLTIAAARRRLVPGGTLVGLLGGLLLGAVRGIGSGPLSALYVACGWLAGAWFERGLGTGARAMLLGAGLFSLVVAGDTVLRLTLGQPLELSQFASAWRILLVHAALTWWVAR
ncbi:MAG: hypothetical protein AMXMBFR33_16150 [Candidatus Xenobia bacterium]